MNRTKKTKQIKTTNRHKQVGTKNYQLSPAVVVPRTTQVELSREYLQIHPIFVCLLCVYLFGCLVVWLFVVGLFVCLLLHFFCWF
jgi:hypothetical protein